VSSLINKANIVLTITALMLVSTGCNSIGAGKQVKQLEMENNRLLSEFRAERQRRETAERAAQQLENRLAESEKLLARQVSPGASSANSPGRLSSLPLNSLSPGQPQAQGSPGQNSADLSWQRRN
jgi:hypothetical protein